MPRARLRVDLGDAWLGRLTREYDAVVTLVGVIPCAPDGREDRRGTATVRVTGPDREAAAVAVGTADAVVASRRVETADDPVVVTVETDEPFLQAAMRAAGIPFEPPMPVEGGAATLTVTAGPDRLADLTAALADAGYAYEVEAVASSVAAAGPLTDRQGEVLAAAVAAGYYETPREGTLADVAAAVDAGRGAVSETLRRAEGALARAYLDGRSVGAELDQAGPLE